MKTTAIIALFSFLIGICVLGFWIAGSHGHVKFRPHMLEDWIFTGLTILSFSISLVFAFKAIKKPY
ncbi:hypothetical protein [Mucilaginibacter lacusdianchii]|uniref:hypothetical protein n=1 Tax=Mucilaginibacter lacusdianchii TaxID=2684211 RepID=UPI00131C28F6|nr:hypothetical protein [Mucilaginibacter sp. JXJ CY 39]